MTNDYYIEKYDLQGGRVNTESLVADLGIEFITRVELADKFETPYKEFKAICDDIRLKYDALKQHGPSLNGVQWNLFYATIFSKIRDMLFESEPLDNGMPNFKNVYKNKPEDGDFFLFFIDEYSEFIAKKYIPDYRCFLPICPQVTNESEFLIEEYTNLVGEETTEDDLYALTFAKNQCLYLIERDDFNINQVREKLHGKQVREIVARKEEKAKEEPETENLPANTEKQEQQHVVTYTKDAQSEAIKAMLLDNLKAIQKGSLPVDRANAFNSTVQTFINMSKAQLEVAKYMKSLNREK